MRLLWLLAGCTAAGLAAAGDVPIAQSNLCVTEGRLDPLAGGQLSVTVPKMRAFVLLPSRDEAELRFTYRGPTEVESRLQSGILREQFGLKLRARDACNLLYVMWHVRPDRRLAVSVKSNPGQHSSRECGNHGYEEIRPSTGGALPPLLPGAHHRLHASIGSDQLQVDVDGHVVWQGPLTAPAAGLDGPVGVRTDNARIEFALVASPRLAPTQTPPPVCGGGVDDPSE